MLLLLGRMVVAGGTVGGSGNNGIVMAGTMGAGVGSERRTSTGSVSGLSGGEDAVTAGGRDVRASRPFVFRLVCAGFLPIVSVVFGEDRDGGGRKKRVRGWGLVDCVSWTVRRESGRAGRESRAVVSRRWW